MSKTILITGASTGIGAATARHFAPGNEVIVHYFSSSAAAEGVAADVVRAGGKAHLAQGNLATEAGCRELASFAAETCGRLERPGEQHRRPRAPLPGTAAGMAANAG